MALDFTVSVADRVDHGSNASLVDLNPCTFMEWVNPQAFISANVVGFTKASSSVRSLRYYLTSGDLEGFIGRASTNSQYRTNSGGLTLNTWNFLAWTFDLGAGAGEVQNIYVGDLNTLAVETGYVTATDGSGALTTDAGGPFLLANRSTLTKAGDCKIAVATYCNVALTLAQIRAWQFRPRKLTSSVLYCHYGFNGTGVQPDLSGNGNNGVVTNATVADHVPLGPPFGFDPEWQGAFSVTAANVVRLRGRWGVQSGRAGTLRNRSR